MASYVLGVDAGNSKTIALVARSDGNILGIGRSGCGDIYGSFGEGGETAIQSSVTAAEQALAMASLARDALSACVFSAAGADWPEDFEYFRSELGARGLGTPIIYNDAIGALRAGSPDGTGVVVAVGTGVATGARSPDGRIWHSSFWQEAQGSVELARKTLRAVYRTDLGIDPPTALTGAVLRHFAQPTVEAVLHSFTARLGTPPDNLTGLTRILFDLAGPIGRPGDATAQRIISDQGAMLGDYALAAARRVGIEGTPFHLVLTGGVLRHPSPLLAEAIIARVHTTSPDAQPRKSRFEPAIGALLLALEATGVAVDEAILAAITRTMSPESFFDT
jgi:N-acetylglucosamine kinase-like BadF-type ATPase